MTAHDWRDVLLKASERINDDTWCQGHYWTGDSGLRTARARACAAGHMMLAADEMGVSNMLVPKAVAMTNCLVDDVMTFNDAPGRTAAEVADLLRRAAEGTP